MKVLVIEEEPLSVRRLKEMLVEVDHEVHVVDVIDNMETGTNYLKASKDIDLIFVDISAEQDPQVEIFREACTETPVIFISACKESALKAFRFNSVDYLLKPLQKDALEAAIHKYKKWHSLSKPSLQRELACILDNISSKTSARERFLAKSGTRYISVAANDIAYFYTKGKLQYIKTRRNEDLVIDKRLDEIEADINGTDFFRVNRQFILNYSTIEKVHAWFSGKLKVQVNPLPYEEIIISRLRAARFRKWLGE
ncbi:LytTR family DNA-binding domain-containing protein [Terrimonas sp. NA20]|uniref:LytTR family DNA-binding domain-containing protein n=1 Tax=Terrimonas ginsenosidimutans TaxID=2908004 RepID=A0ABS9KU29_9BACT|nr:LytTR family DNA-binding domain-containing protein [Terrimonas ginsenosidimutans]MCG2615847.1 LytTR family DNA-binding domain-containing protein [Terrimonas ginsenosidimutans]